MAGSNVPCQLQRIHSEDLCLQLRNVGLSFDKKHVLTDVSLTALSGQILSIMGPTGSGKTTLLDVISGHLKHDSGEVTLNGETFSKRLRRRLAFAQQEDVFFSQLTLIETLMFTANLRMNSDFNCREKRKMVDYIVRELELEECVDTVIGDSLTKGLSSGEKKRVSIASELIVDPDILLLDEPTSHLDSSTALTVSRCLKRYATTWNRMIIMSIHQPSNQIFELFDSLLLLADGKVCYFGDRGNMLPFFEDLGKTCGELTNPADFLMEQLKPGEEDLNKTVLKFVSERGVSYRRSKSKTNTESDWMPNSESSDSTEYVEVGLVDDGAYRYSEESAQKRSLRVYKDRWMTSWWSQYKVLTGRSVRQTTKVLLQGYLPVQIFVISCVSVLGYFNVQLTYETSRDVAGMINFCCAYWTIYPPIFLIIAYEEEKDVLRKERTSGAYRLSAYYFARITGELPMILTLPVFMWTLLFWMAGLGDAWQFFVCLVILIIQTMATLALGLTLVALFDDSRTAMACLLTYYISGYILGGFYTRTSPDWYEWIKYCTTFYYPYSSMYALLMGSLPNVPCNETLSSEHYTVCEMDTSASVTVQDILAVARIELPFQFYLVVMICYLILFRVFAYLVLRCKNRTSL